MELETNIKHIKRIQERTQIKEPKMKDEKDLQAQRDRRENAYFTVTTKWYGQNTRAFCSPCMFPF